MMKFLIVTIISLFPYIDIYCQDNPRPDPVVDRQFNRITERPLLLGGTEGSGFIFPEYVTGDIFTKSDTLEGVNLNIDLLGNTVTFSSKQGIRYIHDFNVTAIRLRQKEQKYYFPTVQLDSSVTMPGFSLLLYKGPVSLYKVYYIKEYKRNYNIIMNEGSTKDRIVVKNDLYLHAGNRLFKVPGNKRKFSLLFGQQANDILIVMKENKLSPGKED